MVNIVQPKFVVLQAAQYNEYCDKGIEAEFSEIPINVDEIEYVNKVPFDVVWDLAFTDNRNRLVIKDFDIDEFFRCIAKLEKKMLSVWRRSGQKLHMENT